MPPQNESGNNNTCVALGVVNAQSVLKWDYIGVLFNIFF